MRTHDLDEARGNLSALLDAAIAGEHVLITRAGAPLVRLVAEQGVGHTAFGIGAAELRGDASAGDASLRAQAAAWRPLVLAQAPSDPRALDVWLQHAAGALLMQRVRAAGMSAIEPDAPPAVAVAAARAVDETVYALMMLIDGVSGGLANEQARVDLAFAV